MKHNLRPVLLAVCLLLLAGCRGTPDTAAADPTRIGVVLKTMDSEYWMNIRSGMEHAAQDAGAELVLLYPSNEWAVEEQRAMLNDLLSDGRIDALVAAPCDSTATGWLADAAEAQGLPLFMTDTRAFDRSLPYIGADNRWIGTAAAQYLADALPAGSQVAVITGSRWQAPLYDRVEAFRKALQADGRITVNTVCYNNSGVADAVAVTNDLLAAGEIDGIFCTSGALGMGAVAAKTEAQSGLVLVAVDTQNDALKAVQLGSLDALISQSGYEVGQRTIACVLERLADKPVALPAYVSGEVLTQENIAAYLASQEEEGLV